MGSRPSRSRCRRSRSDEGGYLPSRVSILAAICMWSVWRPDPRASIRVRPRVWWLWSLSVVDCTFQAGRSAMVRGRQGCPRRRERSLVDSSGVHPSNRARTVLALRAAAAEAKATDSTPKIEGPSMKETTNVESSTSAVRGTTDSGEPVLSTRDSGSSFSDSSLRLALIRLVEEWDRRRIVLRTNLAMEFDSHEDGRADELERILDQVRALLASPPAPGEKET